MVNHERTQSGTEASAAERFFKYFQCELTALQDQMERLSNTALVGGERKDATDHCLAGITRLSTEVKDASGVLPAYDQRTYAEAVKALQDRLAEIQAQHQPKQKFSFKTKKNASALSLHDAAQMAAEKQRSMLNISNTSGASSMSTTPIHQMTPPIETAAPTHDSITTKHDSASTNRRIKDKSESNSAVEPSEAGSTISSDATTITSKSNVHIVLPVSASHTNAACTLSLLEACCVDLSLPTTSATPFASLTINSSKSSLLLCGAVAGPVHITGVSDSIVVISCRQFRMHECENVDVYLYCTSRPIIEDCADVRFAEMPPFYADLLHSASLTSNEAIGSNMWEHVDDFKWLRPERSPNWMILSATEQVSEETWKALLPSKPDARVEEILNLVSIKR